MTRRRLRLHPLPAWVTVVEAPPSAARDRRGLLLFGLGLARGELLTAVRPGVPLVPDLLRRAAADDLHGGTDLRRLAARLLRQGEAPTSAELAIGGRDARGEAPHFRTSDLRAAFGWEEPTPADEPRSVVARSTSKPFLVPVMNGGQKRTFAALVVLWLGSLAFFWSWWLRSDHVVTVLGMVVNTLMLVWGLLLPGLFFFHVGRMRRPNPALETTAAARGDDRHEGAVGAVGRRARHAARDAPPADAVRLRRLARRREARRRDARVVRRQRRARLEP